MSSRLWLEPLEAITRPSATTRTTQPLNRLPLSLVPVPRPLLIDLRRAGEERVVQPALPYDFLLEIDPSIPARPVQPRP